MMWGMFLVLTSCTGAGTVVETCPGDAEACSCGRDKDCVIGVCYEPEVPSEQADCIPLCYCNGGIPVSTQEYQRFMVERSSVCTECMSGPCPNVACDTYFELRAECQQ